MDRLARQYIRLALDEPSLNIAKELFAIAWRCEDLINKNRRLLRLAERAKFLSKESDGQFRFPHGQLPDCWDELFETEGTRYIRRVALKIGNLEGRRKIERGADDIRWLEARNRLIRKKLDSVREGRGNMDGWKDWISDYKSEVEQQKECHCCGQGCHMCPVCSEMQVLPTPNFGRDQAHVA